LSIDKITVDEALISTDVDRMIRTVAERKKVSLGELQQLSRIDKKTMDKWMRVLEDEGYIKIQYSLGGTFIIWAGLEDLPPQAHEEKEVELPAEKKEEADEELIFTPDAEPEELLSRYVARRKESGDMDDIRDSILTNLDEEKPAEKKKAPVESAEPPPEPEAPAEAPEEKVFEAEKPDEEPVAQEKKPISLDTRALVNSYVEEINKEKAEIEALQKEKGRLFREKFNAVEGRMEADLVALTELIIEKQSRVTELKERVLELPDRVDEVGKLQEQLNTLRTEGRGALQRTREMVDAFLSNLESSKEQLKARMDEIDSAIDRENDQVRELEHASDSAEARLEKMCAANEALHAQVEELNHSMETLNNDLEQTGKVKAEVATLTEGLKVTVAQQGTELDSLQAELQGIAQIERWVKEYVADYEKKLDDIEQYVGRSEDDLAELKEAAESLYMRKYLNELDNMTQAYQGELRDAVEKEETIDQQISESKARISELVRDSQEMIRKLRSDPSLAKDFDTVRTTVRTKTEKVAAIVQEKESERAKLADDARTVRKTNVEGAARPVARSKAVIRAKAKARPVSKAAKKKKRK